MIATLFAPQVSGDRFNLSMQGTVKFLFRESVKNESFRLVAGPMLLSKSLRYRISFSYGTEVLQKIPRQGNQKTMRLPIEWRCS